MESPGLWAAVSPGLRAQTPVCEWFGLPHELFDRTVGE
jgi:hypothetical protein